MSLNKPSLVGLDSVLAAAEDKNVFVLYYRTHIVGNFFKCFQLAGDQRAAYKRGQEHCKTMGYRFMKVEPLFTDLDQDEAAHNQEEGKLKVG